MHLWVTLLVLSALVVVAASAVSANTATPEDVGMSSERLAAAEKLFVDALQNNEVLGYQLLVGRRGAIVLNSAGGVRDLESGAPMTTESLLNLASMMKPVAAIGLLQLVDRDLVSLDDPVSKYLPGFDEPPSSRITVRHLLLHQAGYMGFESFSGGLDPASEDDPEAPSLKSEARQLGERGPDVEPGSAYRYNNMGYNAAGAIIEEVSGQKLDRYLQEHIYMPLDMTDTHHDTWDLDEERLARQYWMRDGEWKIMGGAPPPIARANAGLVSTAEDFAKFCRMLLEGGSHEGGQIVERETLALATSPLIEVTAAYLTEEVESEMGLESEWYEMRDRRDLNIDLYRGLGFVVSDTGVYSHGGIYGTFFYVDPGRELFGIILTQSIYGGNPGQAFIEKVDEAVLD